MKTIIIVDRSTLIRDAEPDQYGRVRGTVEVTLRGEARRVPAIVTDAYGWITAHGMVGRYQTGSKAWPASVTSYPDGRELVVFGRDDRSSKFRKVDNIWFAE